MKASRQDAPGASGPGNIAGVDPHKRALSATVLDERGGVLGREHFKVSGNGHRSFEEWALGSGPCRVGASREQVVSVVTQRPSCACAATTSATFVPRAPTSAAGAGAKASPTRSTQSASTRDTLAHPDLPVAFKRAGGDSGPDERTELLSLWHNQRRSVVKQPQQLLNEVETLLGELPEELRENPPATKVVRPRLAALNRRDRSVVREPASALRLQMLSALMGSASSTLANARRHANWKSSWPRLAPR